MNSNPSSATTERRILLVVPTGRDAELACDALSNAGMSAEAFDDESELCRAIEVGAGCLLLAEEALVAEALGQLSAVLRQQPPWSDMPIIVLAAPVDSHSSAARAQRMLEVLGNITIVERPIHVATLVTAVKAALRARTRQYAARDTLHELEDQKEKLKRADQRKDEFLAMLAHELRNPLAAITTALALLEMSDREPGKAAKYRETASRQMQTLVRLVDDLLDVSRITRGLVELRKEKVDLVKVLHHGIGVARPLIEGQHHELELSVSGGLFQITADATRIEQIISNLLSNAAKYTPANGKISVRLERESLNGTPEAVLRVRDTGRGIPTDMLERIFDMFVQVDQTIDRGLGGLGLGLTLVKRLAQMHGGSVQAISAGPGTGSEFVVRLPLTAPASAQDGRDPGSPRKPSAIQRRRVLLVEDSADVRETLKELLEGLGHEVAVAVDGIDGVSKLLSLAPDVALVDVGLPGIDGFEVARRARAHGECDHSYLIALTGYSSPDVRAEAERAGFDLYLTKPITVANLPEVLNRSREYIG